MFYEIKEVNGRFNLFVNKKNGLKLKKSFPDQYFVDYFIREYQLMCCLACKQYDWLYKVRSLGGMHGGINRRTGKMGRIRSGSIVICPECRIEHIVHHEKNEHLAPSLKLEINSNIK